MLRKALSVLLALGLLGLPIPLEAQPAPSDPDVIKGIRQVDEGDYDAAIVTLDAASRRLAADPSKARDLSQAYLYLGIAYLGKGHEAAAKAKFREAVRQIRDLVLSTDKYPPKVIDLFEAAREEVNRSATPVPASAPSPAVPAPVPEKTGGSHKGLIIGGVVLAGAAAAVAAAAGGGGGGGGGGSPPVATTPADTRKLESFTGSLADGEQRGFRIVVSAAGTLEAQVTWAEGNAVVGLDLQEANPPYTTLAHSNRISNTVSQLSAPVTPKEYDVIAGNFSGVSVAMFTLNVKHP